MAFDSYTSAPKVITRGGAKIILNTWVQIDVMSGAWRVETIERESYEYRGLTKAAAISGTTALQEEYTVLRLIPFLKDGIFGYEWKDVLIAEVSYAPSGGGLWQINVEVNDSVITYSLEPEE